MRIHLGGHLRWYDVEKRARLELTLDAPVTLLQLLERLGVPSAEVAVAAVNGEAAGLQETIVSGSEDVDFYPPSGGG